MFKVGSDSNGRPSADAVRFYYVYILRCSDGLSYTGCTDDLKDRIVHHQKGNVPATKERLPVKLISYFAFSNKYTAYNFEKYLKSGSGRAFLKKHDIIDRFEAKKSPTLKTTATKGRGVWGDSARPTNPSTSLRTGFGRSLFEFFQTDTALTFFNKRSAFRNDNALQQSLCEPCTPARLWWE